MGGTLVPQSSVKSGYDPFAPGSSSMRSAREQLSQALHRVVTSRDKPHTKNTGLYSTAAYHAQVAQLTSRPPSLAASPK